MRHRKKTTKLGRTTAHRDATLAHIVCGLIAEKRVVTTVPKAKAARVLADKMVTLGKDGSLAARRRAIAKLHRETNVAMLFDEIAPGFKNRAGGYTRILKLGKRQGDNADMAVLEWVEADADGGKKSSGKASRAKKSSSSESKPKKEKKTADAE